MTTEVPTIVIERCNSGNTSSSTLLDLASIMPSSMNLSSEVVGPRTCRQTAEYARKRCLACWSWVMRIVIAFRALIVRGIFLIFAFTGVFNVVQLKENAMYWLLILTVLPLAMEMAYAVTLIVKKKKTKATVVKWFSPVVFLYLCCACPPIWLYELHLHKHFQPNHTMLRPLGKGPVDQTFTTPSIPPYSSTLQNNNQTTHNATLSTKDITNLITAKSNQIQKSIIYHGSTPSVNHNANVTRHSLYELIKEVMYMAEVNPEDRVRILEQLLLLSLITGRWMLPRGGITRDQLSQLLLVNIGMAADILELFEAFKEDTVRENFVLVIVILTLWQASLLQFSLTKTATKARKIRMGYSSNESNTKIGIGCFFCETELWAICTSLMLQDVPFFAMRMSLIFQFQVISYSNVFFTSKNTLVILLQLFRSGVIISEQVKSSAKSDTDKDNEDVETSALKQSASMPQMPVITESPSLVNNLPLIAGSESMPIFRGGYWASEESDIGPRLPSTLLDYELTPRINRLAARKVSAIFNTTNSLPNPINGGANRYGNRIHRNSETNPRSNTVETAISFLARTGIESESAPNCPPIVKACDDYDVLSEEDEGKSNESSPSLNVTAKRSITMDTTVSWLEPITNDKDILEEEIPENAPLFDSCNDVTIPSDCENPESDNEEYG